MTEQELATARRLTAALGLPVKQGAASRDEPLEPTMSALSAKGVHIGSRGMDTGILWQDDPDRLQRIVDPIDGATLGAALAVLRERCPRFVWVVPYNGGFAAVMKPDPAADGLEGMFNKILGEGPTEADAIAAALEAVKEPK
jgi:hypothetical protein